MQNRNLPVWLLLVSAKYFMVLCLCGLFAFVSVLVIPLPLQVRIFVPNFMEFRLEYTLAVCKDHLPHRTQWWWNRREFDQILKWSWWYFRNKWVFGTWFNVRALFFVFRSWTIIYRWLWHRQVKQFQCWFRYKHHRPFHCRVFVRVRIRTCQVFLPWVWNYCYCGE